MNWAKAANIATLGMTLAIGLSALAVAAVVVAQYSHAPDPTTPGPDAHSGSDAPTADLNVSAYDVTLHNPSSVRTWKCLVRVNSEYCCDVVMRPDSCQRVPLVACIDSRGQRWTPITHVLGRVVVEYTGIGGASGTLELK